MISYFELYDIPQTLQPDAQLVRKRWQEVSRIYHPDKFANAMGSELAEALQKSSLNNAAYRTLKDEDATLAYVLKLNGVLAEEEKYTLPPDFLMEMMELNEAVGNVQMAPDMQGEASREFENAMAEWQAGYKPLAMRFERGDRSPELFAAMKDFYFRKKYLLRLKERLA